jgi:hypothetical protein
MRKAIALAGSLALAYATAAVAQVTAPQTVTVVSSDGTVLVPPANSTADMPIAIAAANAAATNCPSTPPPEAVAAGYTTLIKCWDGASAYMGNTLNWLSCPEQTATKPEWFGVNTVSTNTTPCAQTIFQTIDPLTGKKVLDFHWTAGEPGYLKMTTNGGTRGDVEYAQGGLVEITARLTPRAVAGEPCYPGPTFFSWHDYPIPPTNVDRRDPLEDDYHEWYCGLHSDVAVHDWGQWDQTSAVANGASGTNTLTLTNVSGIPIMTGGAPPIIPMNIFASPYPSAGFDATKAYYIWAYNPTTGVATLSNTQDTLTGGNLIGDVVNTPIWLESGADGWYPGDQGPADITVPHTYGLLTTTDGATYIQKCGYVDHVLLGTSNKAGHINCGEYDFSVEAFHYTETKSFRWWIGGSPITQDEYFYSIAIWGKPTCVPAGSDPTCAGPKNTPSPVVIQR